MTETAEAESPAVAAPASTGHVPWRRRLLILLLLAAGVMVITHRLGGTMSARAGLGIAAAGVLVLALWRYPHVRRHFAPFGPRNRQQRHQFQRRTSSAAFRSPGSSGQRARPGNPFRRRGKAGGSGAGNPFRRSGRAGGSGAGKAGGKGGFRKGALNYPGQKGALLTRKRSGTGKGKGAGKSAGTAGGKSTGRKGALFTRKRSGTGKGKGAGKGSGTAGGKSTAGTSRSRRSSPGPARRGSPFFRRHSGGDAGRASVGSRRRAGSGRAGSGAKPRTGSGSRTGAGSRPRRRLLHPSTWRPRGHAGSGSKPRTESGSKPRTGSGSKPRTGSGSRKRAGSGSKPRRWFAPWRTRSRTGSGSRSGRGPGPKSSGPVRRSARRVRAWSAPAARRVRRAASPVARKVRAWSAPAARRVRRSRAGRGTRRAWLGARRRGAATASWYRGKRGSLIGRFYASPALRAKMRRIRGRRPRRWFTPWRPRFTPAWARGANTGWRERIARRWRMRHGRYHPGLSSRRRLLKLSTWFRRRPGRRVHRPLRVRLRMRARRWSPRRVLARFRARRARVGRPPRQWAPAGRHHRRSVLARFDRFRTGRWRERMLRRNLRPAPVPLPGTARPAPALSTPLSPPGSGSPNGSKTGGNGMADVSAVADSIEELGGWDVEDPEQLHSSLANLHRIVEAAQSAYQRIGDKLEDTPQTGYADAVKEAAGRLGGVAEDLQQVIGGGVLRR